MKAQVFKYDALREDDYGDLRVANYFNDPAYESMSAARVVKVNEVKSINHDFDMIDYVIEGEGRVTLDDEVVHVTKGDLVFIPRGIEFTWSGGVTLLAISHPRFKA